MTTPHNLHILAVVGAAVVVAGTVALYVLYRPKPVKKGKTIVLSTRDIYDGPSVISIPPNASTLSTEELIDKIKGVIYGQAIGDAVGLATEFMNKQECTAYYGKYPHITYKVFHNDFHRSRWVPGDWTDDTDQMILILEGLLATGGLVSATDFAKRLKFWIKNGFPELGDKGGLGLGATVHSVASNPKFETDPHSCAVRAWENSMKNNAANGAVMRTSILGIPHFHDLGLVIANTQNICKVTHADPRCVASCVFVTSVIALMLQGEPCNDELIEKAYFMGNMELPSEKEKQEYYQHCHVKNFRELQLDMENQIGYTLKCLGSGVLCLRGDDFKKLINELVMEGGDSDTNAAVAGALLGCKIGYSRLPHDWLLGLKEKEWLDEKVERFLALLGLN